MNSLINAYRRPFNADMLRAFGIAGTKWPDDGAPMIVLNSIAVYVRSKLSAKLDHQQIGSWTRCVAICPVCGKHTNAGKLWQHAKVHV